jgi:hypothetical protein
VLHSFPTRRSSDLSQYLPTGGFAFLSKSEIAVLDFTKIPDENDIGYLVECDLKYPFWLHEDQSDYPLAVERMRVSQNMLSDYCSSVISEINYNNNKNSSNNQ